MTYSVRREGLVAHLDWDVSRIIAPPSLHAGINISPRRFCAFSEICRSSLNQERGGVYANRKSRNIHVSHRTKDQRNCFGGRLKGDALVRFSKCRSEACITAPTSREDGRKHIIGRKVPSFVCSPLASHGPSHAIDGLHWNSGYVALFNEPAVL